MPYSVISTQITRDCDSPHQQTRNAASKTLPLPYLSSDSSVGGLPLSQPGSPCEDLEDPLEDGTLKGRSNTLSPISESGSGTKEHSNYSWTMMILNKLQKRKNKKNKKGSSRNASGDGRREIGGNVVRNDFIFQSERNNNNRSIYMHRPDSKVEEEITLKTLKRRDRNSAIIRKSLALDDDSFGNAFSHQRSHVIHPSSRSSSMDSSGGTGSDMTSFRESGKGHSFKFTLDDPAHVLWCDICGEAIFSLLYRAIRCENCGYLCHENCRPGVGLDCPAELEKQLEQRLSQVDLGKLTSSNNQVVDHENLSGETSPPFLTPPLTPSAINNGAGGGYDSTSEHAAEELSSISSTSITRDSLVSSQATIDDDDDDDHVILTPVLRRRRQEKRRTVNSQRSYFDFPSTDGSNGTRSESGANGPDSSDSGLASSSAVSMSEEQVQKWALKVMRSNSLYSKSPIMYDKSLRPGNLVGSAARPRITNDFQLPAQLPFSSASLGGHANTVTSSSSSLGVAGTLPTKLKAKDLEKRVLEYAKQNPQSDLKLVKRSSNGSLTSAISKESSSLFKPLKRKGSSSSNEDVSVEFEGFLHVTMCLHRPISVANEVALDFSLQSLHRNMSFERSQSENRTTFYLPYGSEHAVRCTSEDSTSTVVKKLLQKFHVADDPRKYVLFHDVINTTTTTTTALESSGVTRRRVNESERPLYLALLFGANNNQSNASGGSSGKTSAATDQSNWSTDAKHVFVLEENEQPDIQWDRFSEHELAMFLEILKLEEEQHIAMIRDKYEKEKNKLQQKLDLVSKCISADRESSPEIEDQNFDIEDIEKNESES